MSNLKGFFVVFFICIRFTFSSPARKRFNIKNRPILNAVFLVAVFLFHIPTMKVTGKYEISLPTRCPSTLTSE